MRGEKLSSILLDFNIDNIMKYIGKCVNYERGYFLIYYQSGIKSFMLIRIEDRIQFLKEFKSPIESGELINEFLAFRLYEEEVLLHIVSEDI